MPHHRARFTPLGRWEVVRRVIEEGETFARAAARANVSTSTVWGWVRRWRAATPEDRASLACLQERSSRPHRSPAQVARRGGRRDLRAARSGRAGPRGGSRTSPGRSAALDGPSGPAAWRLLTPADVAERRRSSATSGRAPGSCCTWTSRSSGSSPSPGTRSTGDRTRRSRRVGLGVRPLDHRRLQPRWRTQRSTTTRQAPTVTAFTRRALDWFLELGICSERLMTDNAWAYTTTTARCELLLRARQITPHPHPALHAPHQRQGRALPADPATRMGLRPGIRLKPRPSRVTATLGPPLQRATLPQRPRQPTPTPPRSGGLRAQQLDAALPPAPPPPKVPPPPPPPASPPGELGPPDVPTAAPPSPPRPATPTCRSGRRMSRPRRRPRQFDWRRGRTPPDLPSQTNPSCRHCQRCRRRRQLRRESHRPHHRPRSPACRSTAPPKPHRRHHRRDSPPRCRRAATLAARRRCRHSQSRRCHRDLCPAGSQQGRPRHRRSP